MTFAAQLPTQTGSSRATAASERSGEGSPLCLHVTRAVGLGGIQQQARELVSSLIRAGHGAQLLVLAPPKAVDRASDAGAFPADVEVDRRQGLFGLRRLRRLQHRFEETAHPIVHFHYAEPAAIIWNEVWAAKLAGKRVVATLHHVVGPPDDSQWRRPRQRLSRRAIDCFTVTTKYAESVMSQWLDSSRLHRVPCCVIPPTAHSRSREDSRRDFRVHPEELVISCVARIVREKGVFDLLEAIERVAPEFSNLRVLVAGTGDDDAEFGKRAASVPCVRFLGRVERIDEIMQASDLFVLPSFEEGFGVVYAEAASRSVPSIAYDLPTVRENVRPGFGGWVAPKGNIAALSGAIREALSDPQERRLRGERACRATRRYRPRSVRPRLMAAYRSLCPTLVAGGSDG